jgi:hypothetical protein
MNRRIAAAALAALGLAALAPNARAQGVFTARSLGMAGSFVADARGVDALFFNPANLGLKDTPYWSISVPQIGVRTGFVGTRMGQVPGMRHFNQWSEEEKSSFLAGIPGQGMNARLNLSVPLIAIQSRRVAVGMAYTQWFEENIGRDVMDLLVNGYQPGRTDYAVGNTGGRNASWLDLSAAYGRQLGRVSVGVTGHYLIGRALAQHRLFEPQFDLEAEDLSAELREVISPGGHGWGVDVGVAMQPSERLTLSAGVANVLSRMTWSSQLRTKSLVLAKNDFKRNSALDAWDRFDLSEREVDPSAVPVTVYETAQGLYDRAWLPATARAGASYELPSHHTRLSASLQSALDQGALSGGWRRDLSAGVEHSRGRVLKLRAGAGTDVGGAWMLSGGVGVGPFQLGLARTSQPQGDARSTGWTFGFGMSARNAAVMP